MLKIGKTDEFERIYTQKFRNLAGRFGEFVTYERDRGARDIGLHLTRKIRTGGERLSSSLCWFQLKGITAKTLSTKAYEAQSTLGIQLRVRHLQYWYLQPMPTYLAVFVESDELFLVLNLQKYVEEKWGRDILALNQDEVTIHIPTDSLRDDRAFELILKQGDLQEWERVLGSDPSSVRLCLRDYNLIWHLGTAAGRGVVHRLRIVDWQSKLRGEVQIEESPKETEEWVVLRNHWQLMLSASGVEDMYPYLELFALDEHDFWEPDEDEFVSELTLANGDVVTGKDCCGEYFEFIVGVRLNDLGVRLFESVRTITKLGLAEIDEELREWVSFDPWSQRSV